MRGDGSRPALVILDVNETLFSLTPVADRLADVGLGDRMELWFTRVLRDGIAAAAGGRFAGFGELAAHHLRELLTEHDAATTETAVSSILAGFDEVVAHPDVAAGLRILTDAGVATVALTNGSAAITRAFLDRSGLTGRVTAVHDVSEVGRWKPAPEPYRHVLDSHGTAAADAVMVSVHPWDLQGAHQVGLRTAWIDRSGGATYPPVFPQPAVHATSFDGLASRLLASSHR